MVEWGGWARRIPRRDLEWPGLAGLAGLAGFHGLVGWAGGALGALGARGPAPMPSRPRAVTVRLSEHGEPASRSPRPLKASRSLDFASFHLDADLPAACTEHDVVRTLPSTYQVLAATYLVVYTCAHRYCDGPWFGRETMHGLHRAIV